MGRKKNASSAAMQSSSSKAKSQRRRLRKSSFNRVQRDFTVFNDNGMHFNKYETLEVDVSDVEEQSFSQFSRSSFASSDDDEIQKAVTDTSRTAIAINTRQWNVNEDFIPLLSSSSDEEEEEEEEEPRQGYERRDTVDGQSIRQRTKNPDFPWLLNHDHSKQKQTSDLLTTEIIDFVAYLSPSRDEILVRNKTIRRIRSAVKKLWPDADLHVFGSYATDLYLPGSDLDCSVISKAGDKENRNSLYELASFLKQKKLATDVEVIVKTRVPIIKFVEPSSQLHVDVSFERTNGIEAAKFIREWLHNMPGLRELVLIIKVFLFTRRLNNVHTGGLGGLTVICMVYSFLSLHPRILSGEIEPLDNLGVLLIDFFELYGKNFGYDNVAITFKDSKVAYMPKSSWIQTQTMRPGFTLAIQDPLDASNNISRGSFNMYNIKKAFSGAYELLSSTCYVMDNATFKDRVGKSILGNVVKYCGEARDFKDERELVLNRAIFENEEYHAKRERIVMEDVFLYPSSDDTLSMDEDYHIRELPKPKKRKKQKVKQKVRNDKVEILESTQAPKSKLSIDKIMGLSDDTATVASNSHQEENICDNKLKSIAVDAKTRRDYWLSKGQVLSSPAVQRNY